MSCLVSMDTLFCGYTARMRKTAKEQFQDIEGQAMYSTSVESGETVTTLAYPNYRWVTGYSSTSHMVPGYYLYHDRQQAYHQGCLILVQQFRYGSGISKNPSGSSSQQLSAMKKKHISFNKDRSHDHHSPSPSKMFRKSWLQRNLLESPKLAEKGTTPMKLRIGIQGSNDRREQHLESLGRLEPLEPPAFKTWMIILRVSMEVSNDR